ncbi:uncharacterized protein BDCG_00781 [Blastomyces dermatitidis ER-3]|uniref:Uncharacterized protein n=1 Tax=Ajellomyces dermatitidis (strain ER-3 / ATCC MYA-2586) TaxID=559297 RepID=A0ABP2EL73_AJEDR|nr:uncharacterized protein BDCG_00781 [Blastomyces dermatitidis ER-3]EEQ83976.1 hypothetical protein BDCG_00781 [Blastomyces dermatitidis ER-3]
MSTGDHTAHPPDSQDRDNDDLRFRRPQRNGQAQNMAYQSRIPTLSPRNGAQSHITFSNTRTLKGAFQAAAADSPPAPANNDHEVKTPPRRLIGRERKISGPSLMAEVSSPPPDELIETYQQIHDADDLAEYVAQDNYDPSYDLGRLDRTRSPSPSPNATRREDDYASTGDTNDSSLNFNDISDESLRQKPAQHAMDQARLKRVTQRESPVFSKAKVGLKAALSFENLQRRNEEEALREDVEPSPNVPKTWGLRGRVSKDWLNKASRPNGNNHVDEGTAQSTDQALEHDIDFTARSLQISSSPPVRNNPPARNEIENFINKPVVENRLGGTERRAPQEQVRFSIEGDPIPNSPVTIYRETDRERQRHLSKNDPQELLRTLSRRESPSVASTPEQTPADTTLLNVKTPVVTGAWIDTPAPDRTAEPPQDPSLEINSPSAVAAPNHPRNRRLAATAKRRPEKPPEENPPPEKPPPEPQEDARPKPKTKRASSKPLKKPKLPRSALEAVIEDAKSENPGLLLGESTIDSLQELLDENSTILDSKPFIKSESNEEEGEEDEKEDEAKDKASDQTDDAVVERLNKKLQSLVRSINATQTGLTSLERQIAKDASILLSRTTKQSKKPHHRHTDSSCDICDLHSDGRHYVTFPLPRLWYRHPDTNRLRPTRLSWIVLGFFTWYLAELVMCDYYCHPLYAATCERNCLDPNAPRMPLVIPTMLWRWSHLSVILNPVWTILVAGFRFIAQLLGLWDGFFDSPPGGEWPVVDYQHTNIPAHAPNFELFESDMGMMQDEFV